MGAAMATPDWIFAGILLLSTLLGLWRGLVSETVSLVSWVAAFWLAQWFADAAAAWLPFAGMAHVARHAAGFVCVFIATLLVGAVVGWLLSQLLSAVGLGLVNRLLGGMFGLLRGVMVLLVAVTVVGMTPLSTAAAWRDAESVRWTQSTLVWFKPLLPPTVGKYLSSL